MVTHKWIASAACSALVVVAACKQQEKSAQPAAELAQPALPATDDAAIDAQPAPAAAKTGAELTVEQTIEVPASPAELWAFVGQFDRVGNLVPGLANLKVEGEGIGATRSFEVNGARITEKLDALEDGTSYSYSFVEAPLPVEDYHGTIAVSDAGDGMSAFTWQGTFKAKGVSDEEARTILEGIYAAGVAEVAKKFPAEKK
jgi:carbon monoxide dehydrogenase subunit G